MKARYYLLITILIANLPMHKLVAQAAKIDSGERESERLRWNQALVKDTTYPFSKAPNAYLMQVIKGRKVGKAVDIAMGQGRNAIYLAQQGWSVTGFDIADEALAFAREDAKRHHVQINIVQQGMEEFNFGTEQWDLISYIYAGCIDDVPGLIARMKKGLKKGGILVFEFFHRDAGIAMKRDDFGCVTNATREFLIKEGGFKIIDYQEKEGRSDYGLDKNKMVYMTAQRQ